VLNIKKRDRAFASPRYFPSLCCRTYDTVRRGATKDERKENEEHGANEPRLSSRRVMSHRRRHRRRRRREFAPSPRRPRAADNDTPESVSSPRRAHAHTLTRRAKSAPRHAALAVPPGRASAPAGAVDLTAAWLDVARRAW